MKHTQASSKFVELQGSVLDSMMLTVALINDRERNMGMT